MSKTKFGPVDIFIAAALIFAGVFIFRRFAGKAENIAQTQEITFKFYSEESPDFSVAAVKVGDRLEDETNGNYLGRITEVNAAPGYVFNPDAGGNVVKSFKDGYNSVEIVSKVQARPYSNGVIIQESKYEIGYIITVRAGMGKLFGKVSGLEVNHD